MLKWFIAGVSSTGMLFAQDTYVTCQLDGQLGNQMFQIAAAVSYGLDHQCEARFPRLKEALGGELNHRLVFHRLISTPFPEGVQFFSHQERTWPANYIYAPIPYEQGKHVCIYGYFQNENYFSKHAEIIKELFAPTDEMMHEIQIKYGHLLKKPTVAVHVRTFFPDGHYPAIGRFRDGNWIYFEEAINKFPENYTFLIFSDAPAWVQEHFPKIRKDMHFIEGNSHCFDFYLMSSCDHQVISPLSTFSWWAAWLNPNPHKIIIAPDDLVGIVGEGRYPSNWIKIRME